MANPQVENGHTQIANEILDNLAAIHLPPNQWQVLVYIIRKTYGYKKKVDYIANSQIQKATGLGKTVVSRALKGLHDKNMIYRQGKICGLQKDWQQWKVSSSDNSGEVSNIANSGIANDDGKVSNSVNNEKLAEQSTELAILSTELAELSTKVSSPAVAQKKKETIQKKLSKRKHGEFQNVLLTDEEYQKLKERFAHLTEGLIEELSGGIASRSYKYKSHYATILNWQRRKEGNAKTKDRRLPTKYTPTPDYPDL